MYEIYSNNNAITSSRGNHMYFDSILEAKEHLKNIIPFSALRINELVLNQKAVFTNRYNKPFTIEIREVI